MRDGKFVSFQPYGHFSMAHYEYSDTVNIDRWGGRRTADGAEESNARPLVPFLGDSFTFGAGVQDNETFVALLNADVCRARGYECINLGVPGSALPNHLDIVTLRHASLASPPLYVFVIFLGNDLGDIIAWYTKTHAAATQKTSVIQSVSPRLARINDFAYHNPFLKRLYLLQFVRAEVLNLYNYHRSTIAADPIFAIMDKRDNGYYLEAQDRFRIVLGQLSELSKSLSFKSLFILIPDRHQVYPPLLEAKRQYYRIPNGELDAMRPNRLVIAELERMQKPYIDTTPCLVGHEHLYYIQDNHLNAAGQKMVASCISLGIRETLETLGSPVR
jgi:hypothetical protein